MNNYTPCNKINKTDFVERGNDIINRKGVKTIVHFALLPFSTILKTI